tara:strand:+ start:1663 stop:2379 length:717 start_codon:yes stop_codon:yes gene_type:complete
MNFISIVRKILNFFDSFQQKKIIRLINNKFSTPIIIFDIGAHYGETIKIFQKKINCKKIYSFEASPINFKILKENFRNNYCDKLEIYNYGVGKETISTFINQTLESSSSTINNLNIKSKYFHNKLKILNIKNKESFSKKIPINIISLDNFINEKKIHNIDLLKIDTEGYEFNVLKGLNNSHNIIKLIYFEHHYDDMILKNYKFSDIHYLLKSYGFKKIIKSKMLFRKSFEYVYENQIE